MDTNDSRISDKKDTELSRRLLKALADGDFDEAKNVENERDQLEKSARTVPASEAIGEPIKQEDDDIYIPEEDTKIVFSDEDDDEIEDGRVDPREGLNLKNDLEDTETTATQHEAENIEPTKEQLPENQTTPETETTSSAEQEPQAPAVNEPPQTQQTTGENATPQVAQQPDIVSADTAAAPSTTSDFNYEDTYDYDETNEEEKQNPFKKIMQWVMEDETGNRKWLVIGGTAAIVAVLVLIAILVTGNKENEQQPAQPETQETQEVQESQQQAAELPGIIQPVNVTTRCANEDSNPAAMFDPNKTTAWVCQRAMGVDGVVAEIDFGKEVTVTQVSVVPGFDYLSNTGTNEWTNYRTVNRIAWQMDESGKETIIQDIAPAQGSEATKTLENPVKTRKIYMKIMGTQKSDPAAPDAAPGSPQDAFAVGNVTITGTN